jgi:hypothetical protein
MREQIVWNGYDITITDEDKPELEDAIATVVCPSCEQSIYLFPTMQECCMMCGHLWSDGLWLDGWEFVGSHPDRTTPGDVLSYWDYFAAGNQ